MKRLFYLLALAVVLILQGCTKDQTAGFVPDDSMPIKVQISGDINQRRTTRVDENGFCTGDNVGVYLVNYNGQTPGTLQLENNQADNIRFTLQENGIWKSEFDIYYKDDNTNVDFYAYYPYDAPTSIEAYPFEVAKDQTKPAEHGQMAAYEASDFLWATAKNIAPTDKTVNLLFQHKMSSACIRLIEGGGWIDAAEFAAVKKEVLISSTIRNSTIDLATGVVTPVGEVPLDGIIPINDNGEFRAIVVPQSVAAGETVLTITIDGYTRKYVRDEITEYLPGKITNFDLSVKKIANTGEIEIELVGISITDWKDDNTSHNNDAREYVVVHCPVAGQLEFTMVERMEMDYTAVKNLKLTGCINSDDYRFMKEKMTSLMRLNLREVESKIDGVYQIPYDAFNEKSTLIKCILPDKLERISDLSFAETSLTGTLQIPEGVKYVGGYESTNITGVQFPSTLEEIGYCAFGGCKSLLCELLLPHSLKKIGGTAFSRSGIQGNLILPDGLEEIGSNAFLECYGLRGSLTIPKGMKVIEYCAFCSCNGFTGNLTLPNGLTEIDNSAFSGTKFKGELNIPSTVTKIGLRAFANTEFNGTIILPQNLIMLDDEAFYGCRRLSGVVEIPENIAAIPSFLFYGCINIEGIVLHKNVEVIGNSAFYGCSNISSIISKAKHIPIVGQRAFEGIAKDNFTVEVPEESLKAYQFASGWNEFKRFAAHREFSISRNLVRVLNDKHSVTMTLRAPSGEAWSVESAPEWVTVTPSSGVGKVEVAITVNEMAAADVDRFVATAPNDFGVLGEYYFNGRGGEVVFLLNGKDYRTRTTVEQYDYEYGDGDLVTLQNKSIGKGVNIVLMGDCFDAQDIARGKYLKAMQDAKTYFFDIEPYKTYKDYFNVYAVVGMSADSGMGTVSTIREARFGSQYLLNEGVCPNYASVFEGACIAPINNDISTTLVILIENSPDYGGATASWGDGSAIAIVPMSTDPAPYDFQGLIHHNAGGHGFGKLADENIIHNAFIQSCLCKCGCHHVDQIYMMKACGFYQNISLTRNMKEVPWSHMIYDPQYSNVVDIYEGAAGHSRGVYRSETASCMNNNIPYYNAISREAIVKRIMSYAGEEYSYEKFKEKDYESLPSTTTFSTMDMYDTGVKVPWVYDHSPLRFMGEKPEFNKNKF